MDKNGNKIIWAVVIISAIAIIGLMFINFMPSQTSNIKTAIGNELSSFENGTKSDSSSSSSSATVGPNLIPGTSSDLQTSPETYINDSGDTWGGVIHTFSSDELNSIKGDKVTVRVFIHNTTTHTVNLGLWTNHWTNLQYGVGTGVPAGTDGYSTITGYTIPSNATTGDISIRANKDFVAISGTQYKELKMEKGSVATPWVP